MKVSTFVTRAMSALGKKTMYKSPGKTPSFDASVWTTEAQSDCSGFVNWCLRFKPTRKVDHPLYKKINGGWFETTAIHADGLSQLGYFSKIDSAKPGSMLVYPDYVDNDGKNHEGHIGIVLEATEKGVKGVTKIIHCSFGNYKEHGDAILVTGSEIWQRNKNSIIVWFCDLEEENRI